MGQRAMRKDDEMKHEFTRKAAFLGFCSYIVLIIAIILFFNS